MAANPPAAAGGRDLDRMLGRLVNPALADLADQLRSLAALSAAEREVVNAAARAGLRQAVWLRVNRVVVLELHAARLTGKLTAAGPRGRWQQWLAQLEQPGGWEALAKAYPPLLSQLQRLAGNRCAAALALARRFGADRAGLVALLGTEPGELTGVSFDAGDSHQGGHTVSLVRCHGGRLVYKPRSLAVDAVLGRLLPRLLPDEPPATRIRVPAVLTRSDHAGHYGWAAHVEHRYCASEQELRCFYRGLGHWLAIMRLLGGSDLHLQNLIAAGPVPMVVDCESLFTPYHDALPSGYGQATDAANDQVRRSVLRTGLLPGRGAGLAWRGADGSAAASLPDQQPEVEVATMVDFGTDRARLVSAHVRPPAAGNLPSRKPDLHAYWPVVMDAFSQLAGQLRASDRAGALWPLLSGFADCPVRVVLRDTASYQVIEQMLWHPKALHSPELAHARGAELLARHAENQPGAPGDPAVIAAELADLCAGDIPTFTTSCGSGVLDGPGGTRFGAPEDLLASAMAAWRAASPAVDRQVIQAALVGAYQHERRTDGRRGRVGVPRVRSGDLEPRRRRQAAAIMRELAATAIRGGDGTAAWVGPGLDATGWAVRTLGPDLYNGVGGVAVLLAAYQLEAAAGRADPVPGLARLLDGALQSLRLAEAQEERDRARAAEARIRLRPPPAGGYLGLGSRIWAWLLLHDLGAVGASEAYQRSVALAGLLPAAIEADQASDLLAGAAGAVVPLLRLSQRTGQPRWQGLAGTVGHRLRELSTLADGTAYWASRDFPDGMGGLSHGVTGFGWALARLAAVTGEDGFSELAGAAFARDETYYDPQRGGWRYSGDRDGVAVAWCHGSVGIGVAAADLLAHGRTGDDARLQELLHRAASATWPGGFGSTHTLCHGDMSAWELLVRAAAAGLGPPVDLEQLSAQILTSLEQHGPAAAGTRDPFTPSLLPGLGGAAYQLLRMHPDSRLPSLLLPDPGPEPATAPSGGDPRRFVPGPAPRRL